MVRFIASFGGRLSRLRPTRTALRTFALTSSLALAWASAPIVAAKPDAEDMAGTAPTKANAASGESKAVGPGTDVEPLGSSSVLSSSMEVGHAERIALEQQTWTFSHAKNPSGSFLLVRNASQPDSGQVLSISLGHTPTQTLAPRETATWNCDALEDGPMLRVLTPAGETAFASEVDCGDAVYLRADAAL